MSRVNPSPADQSGKSYAMSVADASYRWYVTASQRSRRNHRIVEIATVVVSAAIPVAAVIAPGVPAITAVLGAVLVVIAGMRATFKWQENYLRFSQARETVEQQRRLFLVGAAPYDDPATREEELIRTVSRIERDEMGEWVQISDPRAEVERAPGT
jgi:Protein of unknown function (DUF4231)